ncbi:hypothetical protein AV955_gp006 [Diadromus pulchellus ascovirus 4a]|uniref:Complete DpAV4 genome n=1 Tax=Diadromus pulchellus ascovirus 4a TaxID=158683 RepID=F2NYT5_9VIRU|nr:hypothetical protein AV955_gp006 [Diadromus pulchellus ascovirus 4a]CCA61363.1 unnamed protein product [Diadromus pulchellus ascovirus 4a]
MSLERIIENEIEVVLEFRELNTNLRRTLFEKIDASRPPHVLEILDFGVKELVTAKECVVAKLTTTCRVVQPTVGEIYEFSDWKIEIDHVMVTVNNVQILAKRSGVKPNGKVRIRIDAIKNIVNTIICTGEVV